MLGHARSAQFVLTAFALAAAGCEHRIERANRTAWPPTPSAAVPLTNPTRRVENAVDAGEGDSEARTLRRRLAADASDLDARMALARYYSRHNLPDLALEHYRFAAQRFPDSAVVTGALAKELREIGEAAQARDIVRRGLARHPEGNWELLSLEGILADEDGDLTEAETAFRKALELNARQSGLHNNLGYNLLLQGKADDAAFEFRRAIDIDPRSAIAHNNLAAALAAQSLSAEAVAEWQRAADSAAGHNNLAAVWIERGRYPEARAELETALRLRPNFPAALANLRLVAKKDGMPAVLPAGAAISKAKKKPVRETASAASTSGGR
jgi:Flp pilus assembly protein TadD